MNTGESQWLAEPISNNYLISLNVNVHLEVLYPDIAKIAGKASGETYALGTTSFSEFQPLVLPSSQACYIYALKCDDILLMNFKKYASAAFVSSLYATLRRTAPLGCNDSNRCAVAAGAFSGDDGGGTDAQDDIAAMNVNVSVQMEAQPLAYV